ncbi:MAG TPA: alpha/beta hydrolase family protein [Candidatus Angelobacter sp.]|nr:alpha/beta hydrolase family protein [Candidatus Angelobacter sp.]
MFRYWASFFLLLCAASAVAESRVQCGAMKSKYVPGRIGFCAMLPPSYDLKPGKRFPVLYFLHGLGGDQSFLASSGASSAIEEAWEQKRLGEFVIITPQGENSFYINSRDGHILYEDFFIREFVPQMERRFRVLNTRSGRAIEGISMGGYGPLRFAFKYPQMFVAVGAHMPALLEQLPRGSATSGLAVFLGSAFGSPLNERFWQENTPFVFARAANLQPLKIYFDCGDHDMYGFDAGTRQLDRLLTERHITHEVHIYPGGHNWEYVAQHLDQSLEFHSRAFGLTK